MRAGVSINVLLADNGDCRTGCVLILSGMGGELSHCSARRRRASPYVFGKLLPRPTFDISFFLSPSLVPIPSRTSCDILE